MQIEISVCMYLRYEIQLLRLYVGGIYEMLLTEKHVAVVIHILNSS